jgi:hypothetical protein
MAPTEAGAGGASSVEMHALTSLPNSAHRNHVGQNRPFIIVRQKRSRRVTSPRVVHEPVRLFTRPAENNFPYVCGAKVSELPLMAQRWCWDHQWECIMRFKVLAVSSLLLLVASGAFSGGPMAQTEPRTAQGVTSQVPSFGDGTTGPTNPRGPVQSPDWV